MEYYKRLKKVRENSIKCEFDKELNGGIIMGLQNYLLTFEYISEANTHVNKYEWFTTEDELKDAIEEHKLNLKSFEVIDCIEIINARDIDLDDL
jgi:hypothetical protein